VEIPQLDPIDAAYLPRTTLSLEMLQRKREGLLRRAVGVGEWVEQGKGRKEKREIRNLGN
jgi:hypothetical protein